MDWETVESNWPAFLESIEQHWPAADQGDLLELDGSRSAFAAYLAEIQEIEPREAEDEIDAWLEGGIPTDVNMDAFRDNANIGEAGRNLPPGEDVYSDDTDFADDDEPDPPLGRE